MDCHSFTSSFFSFQYSFVFFFSSSRFRIFRVFEFGFAIFLFCIYFALFLGFNQFKASNKPVITWITNIVHTRKKNAKLYHSEVICVCLFFFCLFAPLYTRRLLANNLILLVLFCMCFFFLFIFLDKLRKYSMCSTVLFDFLAGLSDFDLLFTSSSLFGFSLFPLFFLFCVVASTLVCGTFSIWWMYLKEWEPQRER